MTKVYEFDFNESFKELYKDFKRSHRVLLIEGEKQTAIFTTSNTYITTVKIPEEHITIHKQPFQYCCICKIKQTESNDTLTSKITFLVPRAFISQIETMKLRYLDSLKGIYGNLKSIDSIQYTEGIDTHAKVTARFSKPIETRYSCLLGF